MKGLFEVFSDDCTYSHTSLIVAFQDEVVTNGKLEEYVKSNYKCTEDQIIALVCGDQIKVKNIAANPFYESDHVLEIGDVDSI